ncbi:hypothetical protein C1879_08450 [Paraeggerthella hongkongensis]|nr:hypothetical protein C1879_08450 [Paraeggerthella hongkongensis]
MGLSVRRLGRCCFGARLGLAGWGRARWVACVMGCIVFQAPSVWAALLLGAQEPETFGGGACLERAPGHVRSASEACP